MSSRYSVRIVARSYMDGTPRMWGVYYRGKPTGSVGPLERMRTDARSLNAGLRLRRARVTA